MADSLKANALDKTKIPAKPAPFLFCIISIVAYLAFLTFFEQGFPAMDPVYTQPFSDSEFFLTFALVMILGALVLTLGCRHFYIKPNWVMATICILLFFSDVIAITTFPTSYAVSDTYSYYLSEIDRARYIFSWLAACVGFYMIFAVIPKMAINSRQWDFLFGLGMIAAIFAIIYSYCVETDLYLNLFNPDITIDIYYGVPLSFTNNRNTYGTMLFIGVIGSAFLFIRNHHWWYFVISLFIYLNEFFVLSKTTLIVSTVFYLGYLIWLYFLTVKHHSIRSNLILFLFVSAFLLVLIVHNTDAIPALASFQKLINSVLDAFEDKGPDSITSRIFLWNIQLSAIYSDPMHIIFGFGDHNYEPLLGAIFNQSEGLGYAHMGILDVFGRLGMVGVLAYLAGIIYAILLFVRGFGKKREITFVYLLSLVAFLTHGSMESTNFLSLEPTSLAFLLAVFLPLLTDEANDNRPKEVEHYTKLYTGISYYKKKAKRNALSVYQYSLFLLAPIIGILVGIGPVVSEVTGNCLFNNANATATFAILLSLSPLALAASFSLISARKWTGVLLFVFSIIITLGVFLLGIFTNSAIVPIASGVLLALLLLLSLASKHFKVGKESIKKGLRSFAIIAIISLIIYAFEKYVGTIIKPSNETRYILPITIIISLSFFVFIMFGFNLVQFVAPTAADSQLRTENRFFVRSFFNNTKKEARGILFFGSGNKKPKKIKNNS